MRIISLKFIAFAFITISLASCKFNEKTETQSEEVSSVEEEATSPEEEAPILLGIQERASLEAAPYTSWFEESYKQHTLDTLTINEVKEELAATDITIFMGTWCEDSQRETPAFYKILDLAGINSDTIKLITVSEDKDTPDGLEKGMNITNVPTIIFAKDGEELGRIVEYPIESLEKDLQKILSGAEYKHAYAE